MCRFMEHLLIPEQKELFPPTTTTYLSIGDIVTIKGLVNAPKYNGMKGIIVSEFDASTNRCGVRVSGKNAKVMAIQDTGDQSDIRAQGKEVNDWTHKIELGGPLGKDFIGTLPLRVNCVTRMNDWHLWSKTSPFYKPAKMPLRL